MLSNREVRYLGAKDCPFRMRGENLAEMRRAKLRKIAKALNVDAEGGKQEILHRVIARLKVSDHELELDPNWVE